MKTDPDTKEYIRNDFIMDFKTRRKLYKSGKQWVISTIFSAAVLSGMIFSSQPVTIYADSTPSITNSSSAASIDSAQVARDQAIESAATSQSAALSANSAAVEAVNDRLETAQNNYNEAVANAPEVTKTVAANQQAATGSDDWNQLTTTEQNAIQAIVTTPGNEYYQSSYPAELAGMYPTITIGENSTNVFKDGVTTNIVGSVDQLPLTFYPGILQYDPTNDTSATVSGQLTRDQVIELNDLSNTWMNWMRKYIYNTLGWTIQSATSDEKYSKDDFQTADNQLLTLSSHLDYFNEAQNVAAERSAEQLGYQHSVNLKGLDGSGFRRGSQYTYRAMTNDRQLTANKSSYAGENLYEISGKTMLQLEVDLYNKMQAMLWSEVLQETPDSTSEHPAYYVSGHLLNALTPYNSEASLATQYVDDDTYYVIWEFAGIKNGQALTDNGKETVSSGIIDQIKQATSPTSKTYIDYTGDNIVAAQEALTAARQNAQSELSTLEATAAQINQDYVSAVQAANETYNLALATATEQLNQASNATNNDSVLSSTPVTAIPTDDDTAAPVSDNSSLSDSVSENTTASASEEISQSTAESVSMTTSPTSVSLATTNSITASTVLTSATSTSNSVVTATSTSTNQTSNNSVESTSTASSEMVSQDPIQSTASSTVASTANQLSQVNVISASTASLVSETTPVTSTSQAPHILPATATKATSLVTISATNTTASTQKATNEGQKNTTLPQTGNQSTTVFAFLMASLTSFLSLIGLRRLK